MLSYKKKNRKIDYTITFFFLPFSNGTGFHCRDETAKKKTAKEKKSWKNTYIFLLVFHSSFEALFCQAYVRRRGKKNKNKKSPDKKLSDNRCYSFFVVLLK